MNIAQRIIKNTVALLISGVVILIICFLVTIYLARVLGPEYFGQINFTFAIVTYFLLIPNMGLTLFGTREIARTRNEIVYYVRSVSSLRLYLAFFGLCFLFLMIFFINKPMQIKYLLGFYGLALIPYALFLDWAFQGVERMEFVGLGRICSIGVYAGLIFLFVKGPRQLLFIPSFYVAGEFLAAGLLIFIFIRYFGKFTYKVDLSSWKRFLRQAVPMGGALFMVQMIHNIDTVMLGFMRTDAEVGYYNAAYKIIWVFIGIGAAYFDSIYPTISRFYKESIDSLKTLQIYTTKLVVALALPLAIGGMLLANPIMKVIYGGAYHEGVAVFKILIWIVFLWAVNNVYARGLLGCDRQNRFFIILVGMSLVNLTLNAILIPRFGLVGAGVATIVAEVVGLVFYPRDFNKIVRVPFFPYLLKPFFASLPMALVLVWGLKEKSINVAFLIIIATIIYFLFLTLFKGIKREEILTIKNSFSG